MSSPALPPPDPSTLWGFAEWAVVTAAGAVAFAIGFVWRFLWRVDKMRDALNTLKEAHNAIDKAQKTLSEEHHRTREMIAAQPTKTDMIALESRLGTQLDRIVQRIDTALASR